ncbi:cytochrome P450 [Dichomitus squalens]|uniref:Cytochrome P450 n=1 Tax=Dichomitus squalens TaxID=114155 RepID=A0A4Q9PXE6_9APHY|nr:cytochrome P450 [Dichomitus squalens]TBU59393.1 cytochrome P450 [Dichomitus squalens]
MSLSVLLVFLLGVFVLWKPMAKFLLGTGRLDEVAGPRKEHWLTGNFHRLFRDGYSYHDQLVRQYGGVCKVHGMLGVANLMVSDPRALHQIVVKEQDVYQETDMFLISNRLIFGEGLISTVGEQHKKQRKMLNSVFSLANMRAVLPVIQPIADTLLGQLCAALPEDGGAKEIDVLPWMARGTLEYVGRGILGISLGTLDPSEAGEYIGYANAIRSINPVGMKLRSLRPFIPMIVRNISRFWRNKLVDWLPVPALRDMRDISYVLHASARRMIEEKKVEMERGDGSKKKHLMNIMLQANMSTSETDRLTEDELLGQINTLFLGGQETTTSALARILHILAGEQSAQARLRAEVRQAKLALAAEGLERVSLPYDALVSLPYLDAVVRETLRLYPPTNLLNRTATKDATLPLEFPVRSTSGRLLHAIHVPTGTNILMDLLGANRNREVWGEDAAEWRPERWLGASRNRYGSGSLDLAFGEEAPERVMDATPGSKRGIRYPGVYASMMTFLGGSRACIGFKFAEMEIKQIISTLVSQVHFALPSAMNEEGIRKEIHWRMDGLQVPVVRPPHGDLTTMQVPLDIRSVRETDFL